MIAAMCRKKNVKSSVRMCEPSTSASVMITILWYRMLTGSKSSPIPVPSAVMSARISANPSILSRRAFSTFRILPRSGRIARERRARPVAAVFGGAAGGVALHDEELGEGRVLLLAVGELARERPAVEGALAAHELPGLARGLARPRRLDDLLDDSFRDARVLFEEGAELLVDDLLDPGLDLGGDELVLRLRGELRVLDPPRDDGRQTLAAVVAREARFLQSLRQVVGVGVFLERPRQGRLEALEVRASVPVVDGVGEREERLGIPVVP